MGKRSPRTPIFPRFSQSSSLILIDGETQVGKVIEKAAKELGAPITVEGFVRFQVGEGIEKAEADFADEVAQMAGTH